MPEREAELFVVMGIRGCGKTTLARSIVGPPSPGERTVVIDTGGWLAAGGFAPRLSIEALTETMLSEESYRLAVQPSDIETVEYVVNACAARNDITFYVEELDVWYPSYAQMPCEGLRNVALTGRHHNQTGVLVTHRPQNIHPILLSQSVMYVFPMVDSRDRKAVLDHSKRPDVPGGIDPGAIHILERDSAHRILRTELVRIDRFGATFLEMTLPDGNLFSK